MPAPLPTIFQQGEERPVGWAPVGGRQMRRFGQALMHALGLAIIAASASAQTAYPSKPLRILVPYRLRLIPEAPGLFSTNTPRPKLCRSCSE